jgi:hydroxyethylthiazole kinase-like uncharacterized protein yjeF
MHELLTAAEMARADRLTIEGGVPGIDLMEAAGRAVAETAADLAPEGPVLVLAGPGNNGGDGFVAARRLAAAGREVRVRLLGDPARLTGDAAVARDRWPGPVERAAAPLPPAALVVDALFGAGLDRPLDGPAADLVAAMNEGPAPVLAVDVPSGLPADDGVPRGPCVQAAATVTFFRRKPGHCFIRDAPYAAASALPTSASPRRSSTRSPREPSRTRPRSGRARCAGPIGTLTSTAAATPSSSPAP